MSRTSTQSGNLLSIASVRSQHYHVHGHISHSCGRHHSWLSSSTEIVSGFIMDRPPEPQPFPLSRFTCSGDAYYAYGNTAVEDFLQSVRVTSECNPTVLSLGCGDIRSCFYTLWKNFQSPGKSFYTGVHFFLNDLNAPVLARNIIFLYLCLTMPDSTARTHWKEWIASVWSIWYNHELTSQHEQVLMDALAQLLRWSETPQQWSTCELGAIVRFTSVATIEAIRQVWVLWRDKRVKVASVAAMRFLRATFQIHNSPPPLNRKERIQMYANSICDRAQFLGHTRNEYSKERVDTMVKEFATYAESGTAFAEEVMNLPMPTDQITVNTTLFEREDGSYSLCHSLVPYDAFPQCIQYSPSLIAASQQGKSASQSYNPVVPEKYFDQSPLLANSVQQFAMWLSTAGKLIKQHHSSNSINLLFTFNCGDAINLCQTLLQYPEQCSHGLGPSPLFDAIYTSNLFDHLSPPALVLMSASLLKPGALLFTTTMNMRYTDAFVTSSKYLEMFFGFPPELFPVLLGIRCIGHDGQYSSNISPQPNPSIVINVGTRIQAPKLLVWQNITSEPLKTTSLSASDALTSALLKCSIVACVDSLKLEKAVAMMNRLSPESFIAVLHRFVSQLHPDTCISYQFWEPLCKLMSKEEALKPHLLQLQTQSLLNRLHMHITVSRLDCPLCINQPLHSYLGQYSISLSVSRMKPQFAVYLQPENDMAACITSLAGSMKGSKLRLDFFLPNYYAQNKPAFTVNQYLSSIDIGERKLSSESLLCGTLCNTELVAGQYSFLKCSTRDKAATVPQQAMGEILEHIGDADNFKTVISMSDACAAALKSSSLKKTQDRISEVKLCCSEEIAEMAIHYPYPVSLAKVKVKLSNQSRTITIKATRSTNTFHNESPTFLVDPSNKLAFPPVQLSSETIQHYCKVQCMGQDESSVSPRLCVKQFCTELLTEAHKEGSLIIIFPDREQLLITIHDVLMDFRFSSPAIDVSYCFLDSTLEPKHGFTVVQQFQKVIKKTKGDCIAINSKENHVLMPDGIYITICELLKKTLGYFTSQTHMTATKEKDGLISMLEKLEIDRFFKRAVIYLMYPDIDIMYLEMVNKFVPGMPQEILNTETASADSESDSHNTTTVGSLTPKLKEVSEAGSSSVKSKTKVSSSKCSRCGKASASLKKCPCHKVMYCDVKCQRLDWPQHSSVCTRSEYMKPEHKQALQDSKASNTKSCSRCKNSDVVLKRCPCHLAAYCSVECRRLDWSEHKSICTRSVCANPEHKQTLQEASDITACSRCEKFDTSLKQCPCHLSAYCSVECQKLDWSKHKSICTASKKKSLK